MTNPFQKFLIFLPLTFFNMNANQLNAICPLFMIFASPPLPPPLLDDVLVLLKYYGIAD